MKIRLFVMVLALLLAGMVAAQKDPRVEHAAETIAGAVDGALMMPCPQLFIDGFSEGHAPLSCMRFEYYDGQLTRMMIDAGMSLAEMSGLQFSWPMAWRETESGASLRVFQLNGDLGILYLLEGSLVGLNQHATYVIVTYILDD